MNLLLTGCFNYSEQQLAEIESLGYVVYFMQHENEQLPIYASQIDATVCNGLFIHHKIDDFLRLKFIQLTSAGFDRVPMDYIKSKSIEIHNARGVYSTPMAEWALFRVLEYYKHGWMFKAHQNSGQWIKDRNIRELSGSKVAVIGAGNIGQEVAKRFKVFNTENTGFDIHTNVTPGFDSMALITALPDKISQFDIVIVTAPLLPSTKGLINRDILHGMSSGAMLINISRGGLIDEKALIDILSERKDLFAALDVFQCEPLSDTSPLWNMENVAISPHNSFVSNGNNERMFSVMCNNLKNFIQSK